MKRTKKHWTHDELRIAMSGGTPPGRTRKGAADMHAILGAALDWDGAPFAGDIGSTAGRGTLIGALARGVDAADIERWPWQASSTKALSMITQSGWVRRWAARHTTHVGVVRAAMKPAIKALAPAQPTSIDAMVARRNTLRIELQDLERRIAEAIQ